MYKTNIVKAALYLRLSLPSPVSGPTPRAPSGITCVYDASRYPRARARARDSRESDWYERDTWLCRGKIAGIMRNQCCLRVYAGIYVPIIHPSSVKICIFASR